MKLILIQDCLSPHINELLSAFEKKGISVDYYCISNEFNGEKFEKTPYSTYLYKETLDLKLILKLINNNEKIVVTGFMNVNTIILNIIFFIIRKKYFYYTDMPMSISKSSLFSKIKRSLSHLLIKYYRSKIICVGKPAINYFENKKFKNRLINLPMIASVNSTYLERSSKFKWRYEKLGIESNKVLVTAGSRLEHIKGFDILINAVSKIEYKYRKLIKIVIYGDGSYKDKLYSLVKKKDLLEQFIFLGWINSNLMNNYIQMSDLYVHPSRYDAYGPSYIPLSMGVSVIGSNKAGVIIDRIINGHNGFIYTFNDANQLSEKIKYFILNQKKIDEYGKNVYEDSKKNFSSDAIVNKFKQQLWA